MNVIGTYRGIENYKKPNRYKKKKKKNNKKKIKFTSGFSILVLITIISLIVMSGIFVKDTINLSDESIIYYINETDKLSKDKLQLSWQEVAAIDLALNNGKEKLNNQDEIKRISESFFKYDKDKKISGIKTLKSVVNELGLKSKEKKEAEEYLVKIKNNYLNRDLIKDENKMNFILDVSEEAKKSYKEYNILPSVTIAQAILESGWGESALSSEHNNLFGIKADDRWNGKKVNMKTKENHEDVIQGYFRAYQNYEESIKDHGKFLSENNRYRDKGIFDKKTYEGQTQALEDAGYATAKNEDGELVYADLLTNVIKNNNLMLYDTEVQR